jgi:hypothetical protein
MMSQMPGSQNPEGGPPSSVGSGTPFQHPQQPGLYRPPPPTGPPFYPPSQYSHPYYGGPSVSQRTTNGLAITAMVLGILWIWWVGSVLALIFGYIARKQIKENGQNGDGMAIAGIVLGWIGVGTLVIIAIVAIAGAGSGSSSGY